MRETRAVVVGAGVGGLVAALLLATRGVSVTVLEAAPQPGGKLREVAVGGARIDAGPTVFTMRWVFDEIFAAAGAQLDDHLGLQRAETLARHAWSATERLDLFADLDRSAEAIGDFAGAAAARGYRDFCSRAAGIYNTLERSFIADPAPTPLSLARRAGLSGLPDLWRIAPFATMWQELGRYFRDPRLRQMFGRYATYSGASPFMAPATLMLIAHVERAGVWLVDGGMYRIADALARLAAAKGAVFRYDAPVAAILDKGGRASGVELAAGERIECDVVVANVDVAALATGRFGAAAQRAVPRAAAPRSLSALTWSMVARSTGFPLLRHSVFFGADYAGEFNDILTRGRLPHDPTVYVCAQDRSDADAPVDGPERLFCLVNAPATGDQTDFTEAEVEGCAERSFALMARCGLHLEPTTPPVLTRPADFNRMFPATGGALYGAAQHGWRASFSRSRATTRLPGLYLAGGSAHPGAGVPMAALSGRMAAEQALATLATGTGRARSASIARWLPAAMPGGTSTR